MGAKAVKTAQQINDNWIAGMSSGLAQKKYKDGIQNFQGNPMALAATPEAEQKYLNSIQLSVSSGRRNAALNAADVGLWKSNAMNSGAAGLTSGAMKAKQKHLAKMQKWAGVYAQASQAAAGVTGTMEKIRANLNTMLSAAGKPNV